MIIDAHNHANWYYMTADKMIANMDQFGIDKCWLLSCEIPEHEYSCRDFSVTKHFNSDGRCMPFEECIAFAEKYPDRFILGYAPDPRQPYALERLQYAIKAYDVKICGEMKYRMMADNPDAIKMYRFCGEQGLPVVMHIQRAVPHGEPGHPHDTYWYSGDMDAFERAIKLCPDTVFIGHAPSFWSEISGDGQGEYDLYPTGKVVEGGKLIQMLDDYPNLYCDISAFSGFNSFDRDREFAKKFFLKYQDRILYARDNTDNIHQELIESLDLPQEVKDKVYFANAQKLLNLKK